MTDGQYIRQLTVRKIKWENYWTPRMFNALQEQKAPIVAALKRGGVELAITSLQLISSQPIIDVITAMYLSIGVREARWQGDLLNQVPNEGKKRYSPTENSDNKSFEPNEKGTYPQLHTKAGRAGSMGLDIDFQTDITEYLKNNVLNKVKSQMEPVTRERIYRALIAGSASGDSYEKIAGKILSEEVDARRARLIVRTELNRATNAAHNIGRTSYPYVVEKIWVASRDKRTRGADGKDTADHYHLNGQVVGEDEAFIDPTSGHHLLFPGDSSIDAAAEDVCNCRCNVRFQPKRDENGKLILRRTLPPPVRPAAPAPKPLPITAPKPVPKPKPVAPIAPPEPPKPIVLPDSPAIVANRIKDKLKATYGLNLKEPVVSEKLTVQQLQRYETQIENLANNYNIYSGYKNNEVNLMFKSTSSAYGRLVTSNDGSVLHELNFGSRSDSGRLAPMVGRFRDKSQVDFVNGDLATIVHEFGHFITISQQERRNNDKNVDAFWPEIRRLKMRYTKELRKLMRDGKYDDAQTLSLGNYASTNVNEFVAEAFTEYKLFSSPSKFAILVGQLIDKYFKK